MEDDDPPIWEIVADAYAEVLLQQARICILPAERERLSAEFKAYFESRADKRGRVFLADEIRSYKRRLIVEELEAGMSVEKVMKKFGVSRAQAYRLRKK